MAASETRPKWTPGPWKAEGPIRDPLTGTAAIEVGAETPKGHLSVTWVLGLNPGEDTAAAWADALLVAAAPELYGALTAFAAAWDDHCDGEVPEAEAVARLHDVYDRAHAALAKARGEK